MDVEQLENAEACVKLHQANNHKKIMGYDKFVLIGFSTQPVSDSEATIKAEGFACVPNECKEPLLIMLAKLLKEVCDFDG